MKEIQEILSPYFAEGQTDYDFTAFLTFLRLKGNFVHFTLKGKIWEIVLNVSIFKEHIIIKIPSKPFYLYTEEENKTLIELLKKLCTYKN